MTIGIIHKYIQKLPEVAVYESCGFSLCCLKASLDWRLKQNKLHTHNHFITASALRSRHGRKFEEVQLKDRG